MHLNGSQIFSRLRRESPTIFQIAPSAPLPPPPHPKNAPLARHWGHISEIFGGFAAKRAGHISENFSSAVESAGGHISERDIRSIIVLPRLAGPFPASSDLLTVSKITMCTPQAFLWRYSLGTHSTLQQVQIGLQVARDLHRSQGPAQSLGFHTSTARTASSCTNAGC